MEREDEWNRFAASGKVADYLTYCQASSEELQAGNRRERQNERNSYSERDGTGSVAGKGIRQED